MLAQEPAHQVGDAVGRSVQGEVPGVQYMHFGNALTGG